MDKQQKQNKHMNKSKLWAAFIPVILLLSLQLNGQNSRVLHQSFEIDSVSHINLELHGDYEINYWEGNTVLTETKVELSDASPNILKHFVKMGRYHIEMKNQPNTADFIHRDLQRKAIYTQDGQAWEYITLKVYLPDVFSSNDDKHFVLEEFKAQVE